MAKRKLKFQSETAAAKAHAAKPAGNAWGSGPKVRALLNISAPTMWRWRHDPDIDFPSAKVIKGRLYFSLAAVSAWQAKQQEAA
jgi:predicted DNA-binding transcriptional regulator AlpA